jgi:ectoine hydroxylase-related dioxygenase (phytanoyl-CoA dioxygenase family)
MTADLAQDFICDGYVIMRGVLDADDRRDLKLALEHVIDTVNREPDRYETRYTFKGETGADTWGVNHIFAPELYQSEFARLFDNRMIIDFVHAVLGPDLRFWGAHALWSPREVDYALHWHRDFGEDEVYAESGQPTHVQFNACLLDDASFRVIPGSHRRPLTGEERQQLTTHGQSPLPGEVTADCAAGDVLFMNAHALHRGSCQIDVPRRTLHVNLQARDEPTGGQLSWRFMREPGYLDQMTPTVRALMQAAIDWDDAHRLGLRAMRERLRISRTIKSHHAGAADEPRR